MLIVVEGVDGGGKSTYITQLLITYDRWCEAQRMPGDSIVLHKGPPEPDTDPFDEYELTLFKDYHHLITSTTALVVCDRWHVGETIYGPRLRDHSRLDAGGIFHIELLLETLGAVRVLAQPRSSNVVFNRLKVRGDKLIKVEESLVHELHHEYERFAVWMPYWRADEYGVAEALTDAIHLAKDRNRWDSPTVCHPGWLGSPEPRVLLVGDVRNPRKEEHQDWLLPFTPHFKGSSSAYLMDALTRTQISVEHLAIINAHEPGLNLYDVHRSLPPGCNVVALGTLASKSLANAGIEHINVGHPQWWNRFRHSDVAAYATKIREAARGVQG